MSGIVPAACCANCAAAESPQPVYAIGELGFDFGTEARMDAMQVEVGPGASAMDAGFLMGHLAENPEQATAIIWTLKIDLTPIYAIPPPLGPLPSGATAFTHLIRAEKGLVKR